MMYHPIKCGCKKISSSEDMVERVILAYMSHHYDPELEDSKLISCFMMMHHHTKFGYKRFSSWGDCRPHEHLLELWTFFNFDLDHNRAIQSFHETTQLRMMCHWTKFSCKRISSSEDILDSHYFDYMFLHCDLNLEGSKIIFLENNLAHNDASSNQVW